MTILFFLASLKDNPRKIGRHITRHVYENTNSFSTRAINLKKTSLLQSLIFIRLTRSRLEGEIFQGTAGRSRNVARFLPAGSFHPERLAVMYSQDPNCVVLSLERQGPIRAEERR